MKRFICILFCSFIAMSSSVFSVPKGVFAANDDVRLNCLQDGTKLPQEQAYALGAFFHYGHAHSIRTQDWKDIGTKQGIYSESVGVVIVPYLQDIETQQVYILVPDKQQKKIVLLCQTEDLSPIQESPGAYPSVILTPVNDETSQEAERKAVQAKLVAYLEESSFREFIQTPIGEASGFKVVPQYNEGGEPDMICVFEDKMIKNLRQLAEIVLAQKTLAFLNNWEYGSIQVTSKGINKNLIFIYTPEQQDMLATKPETKNSQEDMRIPQAPAEASTGPTENIETASVKSIGEQIQTIPSPGPIVTQPQSPTEKLSEQDIASQAVEPTIPLPTPENYVVELPLPDFFKEQDFSGQITLNDCEESFQRSIENPLFYQTQCKGEVFPKTLHIPKFDDIPVQFSREGDLVKLAIEPQNLRVSVKVSLAQDAPLNYTIEGRVISVGGEEKALSIPFNESPMSISVTPEDQGVKACQFTQTFTLQDILTGDTILLSPPCRENSILWPEHWASPVIDAEASCVRADLPVEESRLTCLRRRENDLILSWGNGWMPIRLSSKLLNEEQDIFIKLSQFIPFWPLQENDPWLYAAESLPVDNCQAPPHYEAVMAEYCVGESTCRQAHLAPGTQQLPDIAQAGWKRIDPLPTLIRLQLKNLSPNPLYRELQPLEWRPIDGTPTESLSILLESNLEDMLPVTFDENTDVAFSPNAKLLLFQDRESCEKNTAADSEKAVVYTATGLKSLKANACHYASVVKGSRLLSNCTRGKKQDGSISYIIRSNKFPGKRRVVVLTNSKFLGQAGRGTAIQNALLDWLREIKEAELQIPLNFYVVQGDNEVNDILYGEDLPRIPYSSEDKSTPTIVGKISQLTFDGEGFRPLDNLTTVKQIAEAERDDIGKVLFFSDTESLPQQIEDFQIGTLLGWKQDGINVSIVTDSHCQKWEYRNVVECITLPDSPEKEDIKKILGQF